MEESVVNTILAHLETAAKKAAKMTHEHATKIAHKHSHGKMHNELVRAIRLNDKKAVHEHFKAAKEHILAKMHEFHHPKAKTEVKPAVTKKVEDKVKRKPKQLKTGRKPDTKERAKDDIKKVSGFVDLLMKHPEYHAALKSKRTTNPHRPHSLDHRAYQLGMGHRGK